MACCARLDITFQRTISKIFILLSFLPIWYMPPRFGGKLQILLTKKYSSFRTEHFAFYPFQISEPIVIHFIAIWASSNFGTRLSYKTVFLFMIPWTMNPQHVLVNISNGPGKFILIILEMQILVAYFPRILAQFVMAFIPLLIGVFPIGMHFANFSNLICPTSPEINWKISSLIILLRATVSLFTQLHFNPQQSLLYFTNATIPPSPPHISFTPCFIKINLFVI